MYTKTALIMAGIMLVGTAAAQPARSQIVDPGFVPGDLLYGIERASEKLELVVASAPVIGSQELRAKVLANHAEERLAEAKALAEKNRSNRASKAMEEYQEMLNRSARLASRTGNEELSMRLENVTGKHVEVLTEVRERVPAEARPGIDRAIENAAKARRGLEKSREQTGVPDARDRNVNPEEVRNRSTAPGIETGKESGTNTSPPSIETTKDPGNDSSNGVVKELEEKTIDQTTEENGANESSLENSSPVEETPTGEAIQDSPLGN